MRDADRGRSARTAAVAGAQPPASPSPRGYPYDRPHIVVRFQSIQQESGQVHPLHGPRSRGLSATRGRVSAGVTAIQEVRWPYHRPGQVTRHDRSFHGLGVNDVRDFTHHEMPRTLLDGTAALATRRAPELVGANLTPGAPSPGKSPKKGDFAALTRGIDRATTMESRLYSSQAYGRQ